MSKGTILIVEDEAIVAADLARKLTRLDFEVLGTTDQGRGAIEMARRLRPRLVLMDIHLNGPIDGIEAAESIRTQMDIPVIYLTAHSDPTTLERARRTSPYGYILKPFEEYVLATHIELALSKHRSERRLREQREWLRITLNSIGDAVIAVDDRGYINFINPSAAQLTGWPDDSAVGREIDRVLGIVDEKTEHALSGRVAAALRSGRKAPETYRDTLTSRDGRTILIENSVSPILDAVGAVIGAVLVLRDVTDRHQAQQALKRSNQELEQFAYAASHDLQEPLRAVTGFLDLLDRRCGEQIDEKGRLYIERSKKAAHRMHLLIRDLLALSRAATTQIRYAPTDLNDVVTAVVDSLDSLIRERKAAISWDRLPQLPSDANRMHSLFLNLLTNAVKYNKSPIPKVHISSRTEGADYHFLVKDNGIGIESRFYERVFMPFQRLHTEQEYEGTGMGLALCRKIVELFGGKIWITPAVAAAGANAAVIAAAGGSIFHFTLPKPGTGLQGAAAPADSDSLS